MPGGIHPPLKVMATWPTPNYRNPDTYPKTVFISACILGPLTLCLLFVRLWVRVRLQHSAGWDDWLMLVAMVPLITLTVVWPLATEAHQFNRHIWDVNPQKFVLQRKLVLVMETLFCVCSGLIKISILLFYRRLSSRAISRTFRWATWISIYFIAAYSIAFAIVPIFICTPISAFWDQVDFIKLAQGYEYKCLDEGADIFVAAIISTAQDLLTAMLPTILYWNLQIPLRQKIALFGIFGIGYGVVAIGALRAYASWRNFFDTYDVTWEANDMFLYSLLELHIGAMCGNAPALKIFFKEFLKLEFSIRSRSRSKPSNPQSGSYGSSKPSQSSKSTSGSDKLSFWKHIGGHGRKGYLSEPHTDVSVDVHGGVQKDGNQRRSSVAITADSVDILIGRYGEDIEMGRLEQGARTSDSASDMQAVIAW